MGKDIDLVEDKQGTCRDVGADDGLGSGGGRTGMRIRVWGNSADGEKKVCTARAAALQVHPPAGSPLMAPTGWQPTHGTHWVAAHSWHPPGGSPLVAPTGWQPTRGTHWVAAPG
eukprot:355923-Chlamydomonas_euryale.AAC.3